MKKRATHQTILWLATTDRCRSKIGLPGYEIGFGHITDSPKEAAVRSGAACRPLCGNPETCAQASQE